MDWNPHPFSSEGTCQSQLWKTSAHVCCRELSKFWVGFKLQLKERSIHLQYIFLIQLNLAKMPNMNHIITYIYSSQQSSKNIYSSCFVICSKWLTWHFKVYQVWRDYIHFLSLQKWLALFFTHTQELSLPLKHTHTRSALCRPLSLQVNFILALKAAGICYFVLFGIAASPHLIQTVSLGSLWLTSAQVAKELSQRCPHKGFMLQTRGVWYTEQCFPPWCLNVHSGGGLFNWRPRKKKFTVHT